MKVGMGTSFLVVVAFVAVIVVTSNRVDNDERVIERTEVVEISNHMVDNLIGVYKEDISEEQEILIRQTSIDSLIKILEAKGYRVE